MVSHTCRGSYDQHQEASMPLRDHFRPPVSTRSSWEGFHGGWPMRIVEDLAPRLPEGYVAEPRVHLGSYYEIDVCAYEQYDTGEAVIDFGSPWRRGDCHAVIGRADSDG
jgi:hypothetical protein